jgi:hypothetical protein
VLADCPADRFVLGDDYATFGARPVETVERLTQLDAEWIRGNVDRWRVGASDAHELMLPLIERAGEMVESSMGLAARPVATTHGGRSTATRRRPRTWTASAGSRTTRTPSG